MMISNQRVAFLMCILLSAVPLIAIDMPKALAVYPGLIGVIFYCLYQYYLKIPLGISKNVLILCATLFGISALSLLWAKDYDVSAGKVAELLILLSPQILLMTLASRAPKDHIAPYIHYYSYAIALGAGLIILEISWGGILFNLFHNNSFDITPYVYEYNRGAVLLVMCSFGALAILKEKIQHKLSYLIIIVPLAIALAMSVCQAAQLMFVAGFATLFLFPYQSKTAWNILKGLILTAMLIAPFVVIAAFEHLISVDIKDNPIIKSASAGQRLEIWDYVARYALHHPFFGYGVEVTRTITDFDCALIFNLVKTVIHPHNFILQIWIEFGLFGIIIAMGLMYQMLTLIQTKYTIAQQKILLPTVITGLIAASVSYGMWQGMWVGVMFYAAAMALIAVKMIDKPKNI